MMQITKTKAVFDGRSMVARVRSSGPFVVLIIDDKAIEFRTPAAVKAGMALVKTSADLEPGELVKFSINGEDFNLLPTHARQIGGALLRKADTADDFQRKIA